MKSDLFGFRIPNDLKDYVKKQALYHRTSTGHYIVMLIVRDMEEKIQQATGGVSK